MRNFRNWDIYNDGLVFVNEIYRLTTSFPKEELYGLTSQIRRAAVSVVTNMAEGASRHSEKDFARFLEISLGSAFEVETLLTVSKSMHFTENAQIDQLLESIISLEKRLNGFIQTLKK